MVQENQQCKEIQEQFPMAFNGKLTDRQIAGMKEHIRGCADCRRAYDVERSLYVMASGDSGEQLLAAGIDSRLLDQFAFDYESLSPDQEKSVVEYAKSTEVGRDIIGKLRGLPNQLEGLVSARELPLITTVGGEIGSTSERAFTVKRLFASAWRPAAALAAAAAIVVVFLSQWMNPDYSPEARTRGIFPAAQRSAQPIVIETEATPCILESQVFADPEPGHDYSIEVFDAVDHDIVYRVQGLKEFDARGFALVDLPLDTGLYRLDLVDIAEGDTLRTAWQFLLQLAR